MKKIKVLEPNRLVPGICFRSQFAKADWIVLRHLYDEEIIPDYTVPVLNKLKNKVWARPLKRHKEEPFARPMIVCFNLFIDPKYVTFKIPRSAKECRLVELNLIDFHPKYARVEMNTPPYFDREEWRAQCRQ